MYIQQHCCYYLFDVYLHDYGIFMLVLQLLVHASVFVCACTCMHVLSYFQYCFESVLHMYDSSGYAP